ncbi:hypothetical protein J6590_010886 [Homalodisca vitripennis]|nr:hypothetical protein J6590_010886 [Homalodisca vitripennis]
MDDIDTATRGQKLSQCGQNPETIAVWPEMWPEVRNYHSVARNVPRGHKLSQCGQKPEAKTITVWPEMWPEMWPEARNYHSVARNVVRSQKLPQFGQNSGQRTETRSGLPINQDIPRLVTSRREVATSRKPTFQRPRTSRDQEPLGVRSLQSRNDQSLSGKRCLAWSFKDSGNLELQQKYTLLLGSLI